MQHWPIYVGNREGKIEDIAMKRALHIVFTPTILVAIALSRLVDKRR